MQLYRIVKSRARAKDLSGSGAFHFGGRWNSKGTYMLYTSENSSLAYLENLVHFDKTLMPPNLYIIRLEIKATAPIYTFPDANYPANWMKTGLKENQLLGDKWMKEGKYAAIKVKSAINTLEYNYLLNPLFPNFNKLVKVGSVTRINVDGRLVS